MPVRDKHRPPRRTRCLGTPFCPCAACAEDAERRESERIRYQWIEISQYDDLIRRMNGR